MRKCVVFFFLFFYFTSESQSGPIPPIIHKLLSTPKSVQIFNTGFTKWIDIPELPYSYKTVAQHLVKTEEGLFLLIPGTGRIYKAEVRNDKFGFTRIDSTFFFGYNFNALNFNLGTTIYSYGGIGFWHINGNLRVYQPKFKEWNAVQTNYTIHKAFIDDSPQYNIYFVDSINKFLYINGSHIHNEHIKNQFIDTIENKKLYKLDIQHGNWEHLGLLNFKLVYKPIANTPFGIFYQTGTVDLKGNKLYTHTLSVPVSNILSLSKHYQKSVISFCVDSTIYFGNETDRIDSISFSKTDFIDTGIPAYIPINKHVVLKWWILGGCITIFFIGALFYIRKNKTKEKPISEASPNPVLVIDDYVVPQHNLRSGVIVDILNSQQLEFLKFLYNHSVDERMTTIEEINRILGTSNKTVEIQKKMRSDMINGINERISLGLKIKTSIINKQRSEFDKRSFEYFINPIHMDLVKDIIDSGT